MIDVTTMMGLRDELEKIALSLTGGSALMGGLGGASLGALGGAVTARSGERGSGALRGALLGGGLGAGVGVARGRMATKALQGAGVKSPTYLGTVKTVAEGGSDAKRVTGALKSVAGKSRLMGIGGDAGAVALGAGGGLTTRLGQPQQRR